MLVWLDLNGSRKEMPNENFARELMELFTLGEGHYSEQDVREAARAFTGYRVNPADETFQFIPGQFDHGLKTFLGLTGPWDGDQIIDLILNQPACARFLATKLWRFFVNDDPAPTIVDGLADELRRNEFELRPTLRRIFRSAEFYAAANRNSQIKSPVQWIAQTCRTLPVEVPSAQILANALRQLGQIPFYPPNVKGWENGKAWINTGTLTFRYAFSRRLILGRPAPTPPTAANENGLTPMAAAPFSEDKPPAPAGNDPRSIPPLPVAVLVTAQERRAPVTLVRNLCRCVCPDRPPVAIEEQCRALVAGQPLPLADEIVRGLLALMVATPHFQLC